MYIVEYRYRSYRQPWTDWKEHHKSESEKDAVAEIQYLEQSDRADRAAGLVACFEETQYRVAAEH